MSAISRVCRDAAPISITASAGTSGGMPMSSFSGGLLMLDSTSTGAAVTLHWYTKDTPSSSSTYQLVDKDGAAVFTVVDAGDAVELPKEVFGSAWIIPVISGAGTAEGKFTLKG